MLSYNKKLSNYDFVKIKKRRENRQTGGFIKMAKGISKIVATLVVIVLLAYVAISGLTIGSVNIGPVFDDEHGIRKGFDLAGGSVIVYEAGKTNDGKEPSDEQMKVAKKILDGRLSRKGFTEGTVTIKGKQLEVEIPAVTDTKEAIESIGQTAKLAFVEPTTEEGAAPVEIMTGDDIKSAKREYQQNSETGESGYVVAIEITSKAQKAFFDATSRLAGQQIAIMLDEEVISAPSVDEAINATNFVIQGDFTKEEADELAALISDGQLPFKLNVVQQRTASPTLGANALESGMKACFLGLIIVMLFMIVLYRLPGLMSAIALVLYTILCFLVYAIARVNLSLPGIAGVILSIGMAVDANVIIFERMKEEFKLGKTLRAATDAGFHRALSSIIDSNVTTIIVAVVLYFIGTGPIKGFAITLGVGIILSMFTAIVITQLLIKAVVDMNIRNKWLYGGMSAKKEGGNQ